MKSEKINRKRSKSVQSSSDNEETTATETTSDIATVNSPEKEIEGKIDDKKTSDDKSEATNDGDVEMNEINSTNPLGVSTSTSPEVSTSKDNETKEKTDVPTEIKDTTVDQTDLPSTSTSNKRKFDEINEETVTTPTNTASNDSTTTTTENNKSEPASNTIDPLPSLDLPPKQSLGKGKRARIPNKRYSDIILSPTTTTTTRGLPKPTSNPTTPGLENGENNDDQLATTDDNTTKRSSPPTKKQKLTIDVKDPIYMKPFHLGWKRELVYRGTTNTEIPVNGKRQGDIYYYTPAGKKVRSMREISENLSKDLTLENFTFVKEPIGLNDPSKEIIRDAKYRASPITSGSNNRIMRTNKSINSKTATSKILNMSSTGDSNNKSSNENKSVGANSSSNSGSNRNSKGRSSLGNIKVKLGNKTRNDKKNKDEDIEMDTIPPPTTKRPPNRGGAAKGGKQNFENELDQDKRCHQQPQQQLQQPCSIRCQGVLGVVPTLQCHLCLCLYHYECVGLVPQTIIDGYICKNCQLAKGQTGVVRSAVGGTGTSSTINLPPLTPISPLKSNKQPIDGLLPKLQRRISEELKNSLSATTITPITSNLPHLVPLPTSIQNNNNNNNNNNRNRLLHETSNNHNKSLVGSVTSWLPQNSTIQVNNNNNNNNLFECDKEFIETPRPQYIEYLAGRKFLIIPRHNIVSITNNRTQEDPKDSFVSKSPNPNDFVNNQLTNDNSTVDESKNFVKDVVVSKTNLESINNDDNSRKSDDNSKNEQDEMKIDDTSDNNDDNKENTDNNEDKNSRRNDENDDENLQQRRARGKFSTTTTTTTATNNSLSTNNVIKKENEFMNNFLQNISYGYNSLLYIFQYLKVQDLLRAGCVCTMWRDIANHPTLWKTVRMKNSQVYSFDGLANKLRKYGTEHLDLRKMLLPNNNSGDDRIWLEFSKAIEKVETLRKIELCRCPATVIEQLAKTNPNLQVINAVTIKSENMNLDLLGNLTNLIELRLKSTCGLVLSSDIKTLKNLINLRHLSLTSIRDLNLMDLNVISELINLESLDLGECTDLPKQFGQEILIKLTKLEKLRLEKGQGNCHTFEILESVKLMPCLEQLELVNFDIKSGFDEALGNCGNIKKLLLIPTYISQSATTNHMVLGGVLRLKSTLSHFVWGVTLELLRVTELFIDQCSDDSNLNNKKDSSNQLSSRRDNKKSSATSSSKGNGGDSIPVLKPVPIIINRNNEIPPANDPPEVEILPLPNLQKLLLECLPTTRVKILKIPFHATWRQSITDNTN